ncbi:MAG: Na+/H+ antiporter NhaC family protein [Clostridiales bacterium]|nr:Na+/H+ antiporter NhaC family protein [Clostridiales bacterium]
MGTENTKGKLGGFAFLPLLVFLFIYIGCGVYFSLTGTPEPFNQFPRHVALLAGVAVALAMQPSMKLQKKMDVFCQSMGSSGVMMVILIYLMAGGFQGAAVAMGGKDSIVNFSLSIIPAQFLVPGVFVLCAIISTAIGTSMGTVAAMAPVAMGVAEGAGLNVAIVGAAVIGGAYFGDNLSMISDTTIAAAEGLGAEMKDKFRMNFFIAMPAAILAVIFYAIFGGGSAGVIESGSYSILEIVPYFIVLVTAIAGMPVVLVLFLGIAISGVIGLAEGSCTFLQFVQGIGDGMSGMFSISIVAVLVSGIIGLVRMYGGIEWMVDLISSKIANRRGAEYGISILTGVLSGALVNNTLAVIVTCPMAKEIGEKYGIPAKRLASLVSIFSCAFLALMPHDGGMLMITALSDVSPLEVLKYSFYMFFLIIATCITIQFGLLSGDDKKSKKG